MKYLIVLLLSICMLTSGCAVYNPPIEVLATENLKGWNKTYNPSLDEYLEFALKNDALKNDTLFPELGDE
jgi:hypothetical protein